MDDKQRDSADCRGNNCRRNENRIAAGDGSGNPPPITALMELFKYAGQLKRVQRAGWVEHGVQEPESVAEHCYRVAVMAMFTGGSLDMEKLLTTALLHDLCEAITGDLTPRTTVDPALKSRREKEALETMLASLDAGDRLLDLWLDFEHGRTAEGRFIQELDKLEMSFQAMEYKTQGYQGLDEFISYTESRMRTPLLKTLFTAVKNEFGES